MYRVKLKVFCTVHVHYTTTNTFESYTAGSHVTLDRKIDESSRPCRYEISISRASGGGEFQGEQYAI